jgi:uncharacterized protein YdeI (YjbR/CyaY-like superfamily)
MNQQVDHYLAQGCGRCKLYETPACKVHNWQRELVSLRLILLQCGLNEEVKWSHPCYTFNGKNLIMLYAFKEYCAITFFNGALLQDNSNLLVQQTENVQSGRQMRFNSSQTIIDNEAAIKAYIFEAIEVEKAGIKIEPKKTEDYPVPEELTIEFEKSSEFKKAFKALTPGRQRGYLLHFAQPKQSTTRTNRIEKYRQAIMHGKGMHD